MQDGEVGGVDPGKEGGSSDLLSRALRLRERFGPLVVLSATALFLFFLTMKLDPAYSQNGTGWIDACLAVTWLFIAADYLLGLVLAPDRMAYVRQSPLALLGVLVPPLGMLLAGHAVRVLAQSHRLRDRIPALAAVLTLFIVVFGGLLVTYAERNAEGATIRTPGQGFWWAAVSVTTVGYGDYTPVTPSGRMIAAVVIFNGLALIGVITATLASRFVGDDEARNGARGLARTVRDDAPGGAHSDPPDEVIEVLRRIEERLDALERCSCKQDPRGD